MSKILLINLVITAILVWGAVFLYSIANFSGQESCESGGGVWELLPTGCGDSCELLSDDPPLCTQAIKEGCSCGPEKCWNGFTCVSNP